MGKFPKYRFKSAVLISIVLILTTGTWVVVLSDIPLGTYFWTVVWLLGCSALLLLGLVLAKYARSKYLLKRIIAYLTGGGVLILVSIGMLSLLHLDFWNPKLVDLTEKHWHEDLDHLVDQIRLRHPHGPLERDTVEFNSKVKQYRSQLPNMSVNEKIVGFNKLIALLNDGHSSIWPGFDPINSHSFPVQFYFFDDGLYVIATERGNERFVGAKVIQIGSMSVDELYTRIRKITGAENEMGKKVRFTMYATIAEVLQAEGAIASTDVLELELQTADGTQHRIAQQAISTDLWMFWSMINLKPRNSSPVFKNVRSDFYWFEYWPASKTIYVQFNIVFDKLFFGESIVAFSARLDAFSKRTDFDRFIIDIRNNNGGDNRLLAPLIKVIRENAKINRSDRLFTIIGRHTFSAALNFAQALENQTKTLFVGEVGGATPNFYGDTPDNFLPNSNIQLLLSTLYWQNSIAEDPREGIEPDIPTPYTVGDFLDGTDPAIAAILDYRAKPRPQPTSNDSLGPVPTGIYHFSDSKLLSIQHPGNKKRLQFSVYDFTPGSFADVHSALYPIAIDSFSTDIKDVFLIRKDDRLFFSWFGIKKPITPVNPAKIDAIHYIDQGLQRAAEHGFNFRRPNEMDLNDWGYHFVRRNSLEIALDIFQYSVRTHPSSRSFFSLAEIYHTMGNRERAFHNLGKALELDPANAAALDLLHQIEQE